MTLEFGFLMWPRPHKLDTLVYLLVQFIFYFSTFTLSIIYFSVQDYVACQRWHVRATCVSVRTWWGTTLKEMFIYYFMVYVFIFGLALPHPGLEGPWSSACDHKGFCFSGCDCQTNRAWSLIQLTQYTSILALINPLWQMFINITTSTFLFRKTFFGSSSSVLVTWLCWFSCPD